MNINCSKRSQKTDTSNSKQINPKTTVGKTMSLSPCIYKEIPVRYNKYERTTQMNAMKINDVNQPKGHMRNTNTDDLTMMVKADSQQDNISFERDYVYNQRKNNRNIIKKNHIDGLTSFDSLIYTKNIASRNIYDMNPNSFKFTIEQGGNEVQVTLIQSVWRGILLRKQVANQLNVYYRYKDLLIITIKLVKIYLFEAFQLLKNIKSKKVAKNSKKTNCFKSNISQASNIHQKRGEANGNSSHFIDKTDSQQLLTELSQFMKKKTALKSLPKESKEINGKNIENNDVEILDKYPVVHNENIETTLVEIQHKQPVVHNTNIENTFVDIQSKHPVIQNRSTESTLAEIQHKQPVVHDTNIESTLVDIQSKHPVIQNRSTESTLAEILYKQPVVHDTNIESTLVDIQSKHSVIQNRNTESTLAEIKNKQPAIQKRNTESTLGEIQNKQSSVHNTHIENTPIDIQGKHKVVQNRNIASTVVDTQTKHPAAQNRNRESTLSDIQSKRPIILNTNIATSLADAQRKHTVVQTRNTESTIDEIETKHPVIYNQNTESTLVEIQSKRLVAQNTNKNTEINLVETNNKRLLVQNTDKETSLVETNSKHPLVQNTNKETSLVEIQSKHPVVCNTNIESTFVKMQSKPPLVQNTNIETSLVETQSRHPVVYNTNIESTLVEIQNKHPVVQNKNKETSLVDIQSKNPIVQNTNIKTNIYDIQNKYSMVQTINKAANIVDIQRRYSMVQSTNKETNIVDINNKYPMVQSTNKETNIVDINNKYPMVQSTNKETNIVDIQRRYSMLQSTNKETNIVDIQRRYSMLQSTNKETNIVDINNKYPMVQRTNKETNIVDINNKYPMVQSTNIYDIQNKKPVVQSTNKPINNVIIQLQKEFTIEALYSKVILKKSPSNNIDSFTLTIQASEESKQKKEDPYLLKSQIEKVNMLDIIQSKLHKFDSACFYKETSNIVSYIPTICETSNDKDNINSTFAINQFSESFLVIKADPDFAAKSIDYCIELPYSDSYIAPRKIKKIPININPQLLIDSYRGANSNRTLLSKRFKRFINDDLIEYSSHRRDIIQEVPFSFENTLNINQFDIITHGFDLICEKGTPDEFIIQNNINYFNLNESIFTRNLKPKIRKILSISSFGVIYLKNETQSFQQSNSISFTQIAIEQTFSYSFQCEDVHSTYSQSKTQQNTPLRSETPKINKNQLILPNTLYNIITKVAKAYLLSELIYKLIMKKTLILSLINNKTFKYIKLYLLKWKQKLVRIDIMEDIQKRKKDEIQSYSLGNINYSILSESKQKLLDSCRTEGLNILTERNDEKENNEVAQKSEIKRRSSAFVNLSKTFHCSFQLLNIKTSVVRCRLSHRKKTTNTNIKTLSSLNASINSFDNISNFNFQRKNDTISQKNDTIQDIDNLKYSRLWQIIPKINYKAMTLLCKRFFKWKVYSSTMKAFRISMQPFILVHLNKICLHGDKRRLRIYFARLWHRWRKLRRLYGKSNQAITFRTEELTWEQLLNEFVIGIELFFKKNIFMKLSELNTYRSDDLSSISRLSSPKIIFTFSNKSYSPEHRHPLKHLLMIDDNANEDTQNKVFTLKYLRNKVKRSSSFISNPYSLDIIIKNKIRQTKNRIITNLKIKPPRLSIPINKTNVLTKEKLQLKNIIHELKCKGRSIVTRKRGNILLKIINSNYTKYLRSISTLPLLAVYYQKWLFVDKLLFLKVRQNILKYCLLHLNKNNVLNHYFIRWKILKANRIIKADNMNLTSHQRYCHFLSLYIYFNQWKYINNVQVVNKKHILSGYSRLSLFFKRYYKIQLFYQLKRN